MKIAVYAGSFDPITNGHLWMIREGLKTFDRIIVAVGSNPGKQSHYHESQRVEMIQHALYDQQDFHISRVSVELIGRQFLVQFAEEHGAEFLLRGIRNGQDFEYEHTLRHVNADLNAGISTVFLMPPRELAEISSSLVKGLTHSVGWEKIVSKYVPKSVMAQKYLGLKDSFQTLWTELGGGDSSAVWYELWEQYTKPDRHYHNLDHIRHCLQLLETIPLVGLDRQHIALALWFHDALYYAEQSDNEACSAALLEYLAAPLGVNPTAIENAKRMILNTKTHQATTEVDQYMLDIDLAILGSEMLTFGDYDRQIRREYAWVPDEVFYPKRLEILEGFLARPSIFFTEYFRQLYEGDARNNLSRITREYRARGPK